MKNIEDYKKIFIDKDRVTFKRKELLEMGMTSYAIQKLTLLGNLEKIAHGEYKVVLEKKRVEEVKTETVEKKPLTQEQKKARKYFYFLFNQLPQIVKEKNFKKAYKKLIEIQNISKNLDGVIVFSDKFYLYAFLLKEILGEQIDFTMFEDLSTGKRNFNRETKIPYFIQYQLFYEAVYQKNFSLAAIYLNNCSQIEQQESGTLCTDTLVLKELLGEIVSRQKKKNVSFLTNDEIYHYVEEKNFYELERLLKKEREISTLPRLKHNILRIMNAMHFVEKNGIEEVNYSYPFAESDYFHRFFESLHYHDIQEGYKNVLNCITYAKEPFEFEVYKKMYEEIFSLNEAVQEKKEIQQYRKDRYAILRNKSHLTVEEMDNVRDITHTLLSYYDGKEEAILENHVLEILDTVQLAQQNPNTILSFEEVSRAESEMEQLRESLKYGDYARCYQLLNWSYFKKYLKESHLKEFHADILVTYRRLLSILFQIEVEKETIPVSIEKSEAIEELSPVDVVYINQLKVLKEYIEKENYIGALHYYIAHGFEEDYLLELVLLCKENYDKLDDLKNIFDSLFIEENPNVSTVLQSAQIYRDAYIHSIDRLFLTNQAKQEEIIEEMTQKIKQFR